MSADRRLILDLIAEHHEQIDEALCARSEWHRQVKHLARSVLGEFDRARYDDVNRLAVELMISIPELVGCWYGYGLEEDSDDGGES